MKINFFCPRWGNEDEKWDTFSKKVKAAGYDGIETAISIDTSETSEMISSFRKYNLLYIGQYYQSVEQNFVQNRTNYIRHLKAIILTKPIKIDSQTGKDYFTFAENKQLFNIAEKLAEQSGIPILHETHRNKALFSAHTTKFFLQKLPNLSITADFSHWCTVAESLLEDQQDAIDIACLHSLHIHARIGYAQGPQVNDPRASEWKVQLCKHLEWWDKIIYNQKRKGAKYLTITPEFGPMPYMQSLPYTQTPIANSWDINLYILDLLKKRYANLEHF